MPHLNELAKKYGTKGLVVIAASKEPKGTIEPWIDSKGAEYPIFVDDGGATASAYGVSGIPHCALIGPDGKVAYKGHPSSVNDQMLEPVLARCVLRFNYEFPEAFKKVGAKIEQKDYAGAMEALTAAEQIEGADAEFAQKVRADLEGYAADVRTMAEADAEAGDYESAMAALMELAKQYKGTPLGTAADERVTEWKKDPAVKKELAAGKMMAAAKKYEKAHAYKNALGVYVGVTRKYRGTKAAEAAQARADAIQQGSLWKIDPKCRKCTATKSPCEKHR